MEIKISINDTGTGGGEVQVTPTAQRSEAAAAASPVAPGQAAPAAASVDSKAQFSGGLNAGAAPAELMAPGPNGAPMPFVEAVEEGSQSQPPDAAEGDLNAGAGPSR
jgi:hypothetical protein